ncbi:hypothetical protein SAMN04488505_10789 [Chitinophaga rupis]|uniref:Uncharacterized protein n=1 Tax=Chitinophaga rupis TaxID=573321 RepID=A0A1H8CEX9_9BACT|nr:class I lanthipeptide [Chitinophaga rupis]SEM93532.1 hypothetical protein SAMN04488505_10789 [Chitinophaga rupis]
MKQQTTKKLSLGKIKIATLSNAKQEVLKGGGQGKSAQCVSFVIACLSQGAPNCSQDICRY